jgi:trigger factor
MVQAEFDAIWAQVKAELEREGVSAEDEGKTEDELKAEYRTIAERRVRLGLLLAKIGEQNAIQVGQDEVNRALAARARQYPGQEKQVIEYYTRNPQAMTELRVPLFEDKVVDFLGELMEVQDRKVDREILFLDPDEAEEKLKALDAPSAGAEEAAGESAEAKPAKKSKAKPKAEAKSEQEGQAEGEAASVENVEAQAKPKGKAKKKKDEQA